MFLKKRVGQKTQAALKLGNTFDDEDDKSIENAKYEIEKSIKFELITPMNHN